MAMVIEATASPNVCCRSIASVSRCLLGVCSSLNNRHLPNEIAPERDSEAILVRAVGLDPHDVAIEGF